MKEHNFTDKQRLLIMSVPFLTAILIVYGCIRELRNLHGMCYMCGLTILNLCFVMCYDIWSTFQIFLCYSLYAFGCPLLITLSSYIADITTFIADDYKIGIGRENGNFEASCFIQESKKVELIYIYILISCLLINTIFHSITACKIHKVEMEAKVLQRDDIKCHSKVDLDKARFVIIVINQRKFYFERCQKSKKIPSALNKTEVGSDELKVEEPQAASGPVINVFNHFKYVGDVNKLLAGSGNVFNSIDIKDSSTSDAPPAAPAKNVFNQFNYDWDANKLLRGSINVFNTIDILDSPTSDAPPAAPQAAPAKNVFNQFNYDGDANKLLRGSINVFNTVDIQDLPTSCIPTRKGTKSSFPAKNVFNQFNYEGDVNKLLTGSINVFNTIDILDSPTSDAPPAAPQAGPAKNVFNHFKFAGDASKLLTGSGNVFNSINIKDSSTSDAPPAAPIVKPNLVSTSGIIDSVF